MKDGTLSKNLTDAFMLIMALIAVITLVGEFVGFDGEGYLIDHPYTGEEIEVVGFLDDPYNKNYVLLAAAFGFAALLGFCTRRCPEVGLVSNVAVTAITLIGYDRRLIDQMEFMYIFFAVFGLAGAIVYTICYRIEKRSEPKVQKPDEDSEEDSEEATSTDEVDKIPADSEEDIA